MSNDFYEPEFGTESVATDDFDLHSHIRKSDLVESTVICPLCDKAIVPTVNTYEITHTNHIVLTATCDFCPWEQSMVYGRSSEDSSSAFLPLRDSNCPECEQDMLTAYVDLKTIDSELKLVLSASCIGCGEVYDKAFDI